MQCTVAHLCTEPTVYICVPHDFILQADTVHISFKTTVDDIKQSDSRRVDCVLCRCIHHILYCKLAQFSYNSKPQWMILIDQIVGGLTVYCVDAFATRYHCRLMAQFIYNSTTRWVILNGQIVGGLTVYSPYDIILQAGLSIIQNHSLYCLTIKYPLVLNDR